MVEVWRRGADYRPERASLLTWVLTIARSRAVDELRRWHPEPLDPHGTPLQEPMGGDGAGPLDLLLERWRLAHLLARLPAEEALLLRLRFYGDMTQTEIADSTGVALGP
jgi:RNA polymerase sigma-70 factor (ECF subfamily)